MPDICSKVKSDALLFLFKIAFPLLLSLLQSFQQLCTPKGSNLSSATFQLCILGQVTQLLYNNA